MSDQAQRQRALDPSASFIVQAPAGSGKTELLTRRFLRLLAGVQRPESVVAITFTRKATHEMRQRILVRLRQGTNDSEPAAGHEREAWLDARQVLRQDRALGWDLLRHPGRLQIHTIDGLCARIAARFPVAGLPPLAGRVAEDARPLYREAARRAVDDLARETTASEATRALREALLHLDGNPLALQELLVEMLERRDQWLDHLGMRTRDLLGVLEARQQLELDYLEAQLGRSACAELARILQDLAALADDSALGGSVAAACAAWQGEDKPARRVMAMVTLLGAITTKKGLPFAARSLNSRVLPGSAPGRRPLIDGLRDLTGPWREDAEVAAALCRFLGAPPLAAPHEAPMLAPFRLLLRHAEAQLRVLFGETGQADFPSIAQRALAALGEELEPGEALLAEDSAVEHLLVDEFQDTSLLQYGLLERLVSGWQADDGRSLFLVGDPMQSIYRFRKAEVGLFSRVIRDRALGPVPLEPLRLEANFRARVELVDWVNREFPPLFARGLPVTPGEVAYAPLAPRRGEGGAVRVMAVDPQSGVAGEGRRVCEDIRRTLRENPAAKIAVLGRKRTDLLEIATALRVAGVAFEGVDLQPLGGQPVVMDLSALLRALVHPADRVAWLSLLGSPACGLTPAEMHAIAGEDPRADLFERLADDRVLAGLVPERQARVRRLCTVLHNAIAARTRWPLSRVVEAAWVAIHGAQASADATDLANAREFLQLLAEAEREQPMRLLEALDERLAHRYARALPARVQLMTIHKAKGLEFDVVYLPGLDRLPRPAGERQFLRLMEFGPGEGEGVLMAPLRQREAECGGLYAYLQGLDTEQQRCEAQRLLYVAATRARERLVLSGRWDYRGTDARRAPAAPVDSWMHSLWHLFEPLVEEPGEPLPDEIAAAPELPQLFIRGEPPLAVEAVPLADPLPMEELQLADPERVALGDALHRCLEFIHDHWSALGGARGVARWLAQAGPSLAACLRAAGAPDARVDAVAADLRMLLANALGSGGPLEAVARDSSWAELALVSGDGRQLRLRVIDLLRRAAEGDWTIVDYKTGEDSEDNRARWREQLAAYRAAVEELTGGAPVAARVFQAVSRTWVEEG